MKKPKKTFVDTFRKYLEKLTKTKAGGNYARLAGGYAAKLAGGNYAQLAGGDYAQLALNGKSAIGIAGKSAKIKGKKGSAFCLPEYDNDFNIVKLHTAIVDGKKYKEDTFYWVKDGKLTAWNGVD